MKQVTTTTATDHVLNGLNQIELVASVASCLASFVSIHEGCVKLFLFQVLYALLLKVSDSLSE